MLPARSISKRFPALGASLARQVLISRHSSVSAENVEVSAIKTPCPLANEQPLNQPPKEPRKRQNNANFKHPFNRKVRDITSQVRKSVEAADSGSLSEAVDIFEEGISYLREIQAAEDIKDDFLFSVYQPLAVLLIEKVTAENADLGLKTVEDILTSMIENRIAHNYHFTKTAEYILRTSGDYTRVLLLWLRYLEYVKETGIGRIRYLLSAPFGPLRDRNWSNRDLQNLVYFSYVVQLLKSGLEYKLSDASKLLQLEEHQQLPNNFQVATSISKSGLKDVLAEDVSTFATTISELSMKDMDPNSSLVAGRIEQTIKSANPSRLDALFEQMNQAAEGNNRPITEQTLNKVMNAYLELHRFGNVLDIFRGMLAENVKPSPASWELVIKSMGHPSNVAGKLDKERQEISENLQKTIATMKASGIEVNAKSLAVIAGAFASVGDYAKMEEFLKAHLTIPVVHLARNNILIGLLTNKKIVEAEAALKDQMTEDPTFSPSVGVMNAFLKAYVEGENFKAVEGILNFMKTHNINEDVGTVTTIINYYFKMHRNKGQVPDVAQLLSLLSAEELDSHSTVTTIVDGLAKDGVNIEAARSVFEFFCKRKSRFRYSNALITTMINAELQFGSLFNAQNLFDVYVKHLRNDARMYNMMIAALLPKEPELALKYYKRLLEQQPFGVRPNYFTYYYMLDHFVKTGNEKRIQWVLDEIAAAKLADLGSQLPRKIRLLRGKFNVPEHLAQAI